MKGVCKERIVPVNVEERARGSWRFVMRKNQEGDGLEVLKGRAPLEEAGSWASVGGALTARSRRLRGGTTWSRQANLVGVREIKGLGSLDVGWTLLPTSSA